MTEDRSELVARVNRIYWETDTPVTAMAEELGISRRTIYDMIEPVPADERCPDCGGELAFPNRSARMAGEAVCQQCGRQHDVHLLRELAAAAAEDQERHEVERPGAALVARSQTMLQRAFPALPQLPMTTWAAILLGGAIVALAAALLMPRRRHRRWWR